jgi:hypothetical protein
LPARGELFRLPGLVDDLGDILDLVVLRRIPTGAVVKEGDLELGEVGIRVYGEVVGYGGEDEDGADEEEGEDGEKDVEGPSSVHGRWGQGQEGGWEPSPALNFSSAPLRPLPGLCRAVGLAAPLSAPL